VRRRDDSTNGFQCWLKMILKEGPAWRHVRLSVTFAGDSANSTASIRAGRCGTNSFGCACVTLISAINTIMCAGSEGH